LPHDVVVVATRRDHPRRVGLALQLGAVLDVPSVGVTHRLPLATGAGAADQPAAAGRGTGRVLAAHPGGVRPVAVYAGWRASPETAVDVRRVTAVARTPEPLRLAGTAAREVRSAAELRR